MRTRRRSTMLGLLPVVATLALASCDDGSGSGRGPSLLTFAQIAVTPEQLDVRVIAGNVSLGDSETFPLRLRNIGQANLEIRSITLSYAPPAGVEEPAPAFELVLPAGLDLATGPAVVRPSGSAGDDPEELVVEVVFRHHDRVPRSARLLIESNSRENDPLSVVFLSEEGVPVMSVSPDVVDFGSVSAGEELEFALTVFNTGTSDLYFNGFQLFGDPGFSFVDPVRGLIWKMSGETQDGVLFAGPHIIGPARSERFAVRFSPETVEMQEARLILETNDPAPGAGVVVRLLANREVPLVEVRPSSIDFEDVAIGATLARTVHVYSRGSAALEIVGIEPAEDTSRDFTFDLRRIPDFEDNRRPTEDDSIVVPVNDFVEISVLFTPDMESRGDDGEPLPDVGALLLRTNAYQQEITVPLVGVGVISACPIAVADVLEGEEVPPQTSLHLRGAQSMSSCGPIDRFEWTVSQPEGAASVFLPSPTFGNPTFPADVAGTYEFCLHVWDTCGVRSCEADCAEVVVVPDQTLHVELLWSTPGDPDPFDEGPLTARLYGQFAMLLDDDDRLSPAQAKAQGVAEGNGKAEGMGVVLPGLALGMGPLDGQIELRHFRDDFDSNYFDNLYELDRARLDEEFGRVRSKDAVLARGESQSGVFGRVGTDLQQLLYASADYQYLTGGNDPKQQVHASAQLSKRLLAMVPRLNGARAYYQKNNIGAGSNEDGTGDDGFFESTEDTFYGYIVDMEVSGGVSLQWDTRYVFSRGADARLQRDRITTIETVMSF